MNAPVVPAQLLQMHGPFSESEMEAFLRIGPERRAAARQQVFEGGQPCSRLYFVQSGMLRAYRLIDGEDITYFFFPPGQFATDFQSFLTGADSPLYFEALVDTLYCEFEKRDIYALYEAYPRFEKIGRLMAEQAYLSAADRLKQHQTDDLKTRYLALVSTYPELFQSVPQHYIASYLGVKPQSLSRIRASLAGKMY